MRVSLDLDFQQIKALVDQLSTEDAAELGQYLRRKAALDRLSRFREHGNSIEVSEEEIAAEVEAARRERHSIEPSSRA
jgi:hypothetical protein